MFFEARTAFVRLRLFQKSLPVAFRAAARRSAFLMPTDIPHKLMIVIPMQGIVGVCADSICQGLEIYASKKKIKAAKERGEPHGEVKKYDVRRTTIFACVGAFIIGPLGIIRYTLYDWWFPGVWPCGLTLTLYLYL